MTAVLVGLSNNLTTVWVANQCKWQSLKMHEADPSLGKLKNAMPEKSGDSIQLTIDRAVQEIAERALQEGVKNAKARGGMAVVADPHTGKILALANNPTFDPNNQRQTDPNQTKNQALMNVFEPGSVVNHWLLH